MYLEKSTRLGSSRSSKSCPPWIVVATLEHSPFTNISQNYRKVMSGSLRITVEIFNHWKHSFHKLVDFMHLKSGRLVLSFFSLHNFHFLSSLSSVISLFLIGFYSSLGGSLSAFHVSSRSFLGRSLSTVSWK